MRYFLLCLTLTVILTGQASAIVGDINLDGTVNLSDLLLIVQDFAKTSGFNPAVDLAPPTGEINIFDVMIVVKNWGGAATLPTINSFVANPSTITSGGSSKLSWSVLGATSLSIDQGLGNVTNLTNKDVTPTVTTSYTLTASNANGSVNRTTKVTISAGGTSPEITLTYPINGTTVSGNVLFSADAYDSDGSIESVRFTRNGHIIGEDTEEPYEYSYDTKTKVDGSYRFSATAEDNDGKTTVSNAVTLIVDNSNPPPEVFPPNATFVSPITGTTVSNYVRLGVKAMDDVKIAKVIFKIDGAFYMEDPTETDGEPDEYRASWDTTKVSNGLHTITAQSVDTSGKTSPTITSVVTVSNLPLENPPITANAHNYYNSLIARTEMVANYSLRSTAQITKFIDSKSKPVDIKYLFPADPDPRKQDAAKVTTPVDHVSARNSVALPIPNPGDKSLLITWDAWFGREFHVENTGIGTYKNFQLASNRIWTEVRSRWLLADKEPAAKARYPKALAMVDVRFYGDNCCWPDQYEPVVFNDIGYGGSVLGPMSGEFAIHPETWTRYWALITPTNKPHVINGTTYYLYEFSLWVADENTDAVLILDKILILPNVVRGINYWTDFWLEYNTSSNDVPEGRGPLVSYVRNVVMLQGIPTSDLIKSKLLIKPIR